MAEDLPVRGTVLSSSPCPPKDAAAFLGLFLESDGAPDSGLLRGYLEGVSGALLELASRQQPPIKKEKKSRKHRELGQESADVQEPIESAPVLNAGEGVKSEDEELQNGYKKGSGRKRKGGEIDREANEHDAKRRKSHSRKRRDSLNVTSEE